ncbi:MAG TPA: response regulator [Polyangiaceae bacterium]|nr:response regulator [Polyangiaceae bacterium]HNZ23089.1 response regulator [Polyangiaceae bacterium]HOD21133.1 response regulator [Polyangiaceae bacterium]HOE48902.1 response regulator [Polyangiaceae bacterium]HOH02139.1 response regulator [Polyangiaceae bacterium]
MKDKPPVVYLVDDDVDYCEVNRTVLESAGYRAVCFPGPKEALLEAERNPPDLIITDMMMGSLDDGLRLSRSLRDHASLCHIPVLLVTGLVRELGLDIVPRDSQDLEALNASAFLEKPTSPSRLLQEVRRLLAEASDPAAPR